MKKFWTYFTVGITIFISIVFIFKNSKNSTPFYGDSLGYYSYLPSFFIHNNIDSIEKLPADTTIPKVVRDYFNDVEKSFSKSKTGKVVIQYTYGVALCYYPFFAIAKAYDTNVKPNGYTAIYANAIKIGNLFYLFIGFLFIFLIIKKYVHSHFAIIVICLFFLATNLFWFSIQQVGMAHIPLFCLVAMLFYTSMLSVKKVNTLLSVCIGLILGLITLIRPTDFVFVLIPLLLNVESKADFLNRFKLLKTKKVQCLILISCFIVPIIPQLILWQKLTGEYLYYSYQSQSFNFLKPHILKGLFSFENGWLTYTPIFFISFIAIFKLRKNQLVGVLNFFIVPIYLYITYCWFNVQYINGFGSRPMLHLYPILIISVSIYLQKLLQYAKKEVKFLLSTFIVLCIIYNINLSNKQAKDLLWSENCNATFLRQTFFKSKLNYNDLVTFDNGIAQPNFLDKEPINKIIVSALPDTNAFFIVKENMEFIEPSIQISTAIFNKNKNYWLKCSGVFKTNYPVPDLYQNHLLVLQIKQKNKTELWKAIRINNKMGIAKNENNTQQFTLHNCNINVEDEVYFYCKLPKNLHKDAIIFLSLWNIGKKEILFKKLQLNIYE